MGQLYEPMARTVGTRTASMAADIRDLAEDLIAEMENAEDRQLVYEQIQALRRSLYGPEPNVRNGADGAISGAPKSTPAS